MLYEDKRVDEYLYMEHKNDDDNDYIDIEKKLVEKNFSNYMFKNTHMANFLYMIQPLLVRFFDMFNIVKNWKNYTVDKDYYKHKN